MSASARLFLLSACLIGWSCTNDPGPQEHPATLAELRARTSDAYESVDMYKPVAGESTRVDVYQAPMIYRVRNSEGRSLDRHLEFGALVVRDGALRLDVLRPTIYTLRQRFQHAGTNYEQLAFLWFRKETDTDGLQVQGIRQVYDSKGNPAIFEVLDDQSGRSLFYVSQGLEEASLAFHGSVANGRLFSAESVLPDGEGSMVLHTVSQGAEPLGPILYLDVESSDVLDLHCRCSPSRIKAIGKSVEYELVPMESLPATTRALLESQLGWSFADQELGFPAPDWPTLCLRLPPIF